MAFGGEAGKNKVFKTIYFWVLCANYRREEIFLNLSRFGGKFERNKNYVDVATFWSFHLPIK